MASVGGMRNLKPLAGARPAGSDWAGFCNVQWPLADNPGTVRDLAVFNAATGLTTIVAHRVYSAYGQLISQTNPSNLRAAAVDCLFGFTGRPFDPATGLQNNLNRWYDPATGNWLTQDPTGFAAGDTNLYRYCGNSPTNATDPGGEQDIDRLFPRPSSQPPFWWIPGLPFNPPPPFQDPRYGPPLWTPTPPSDPGMPSTTPGSIHGSFTLPGGVKVGFGIGPNFDWSDPPSIPRQGWPGQGGFEVTIPLWPKPNPHPK